MKSIKKFANKIFNNSSVNVEGQGIYASLEELIEQRKYINFVNYNNKDISLSRSAGDVKSAFKGRGMEFEEIRAYEFGDDVRDIDWRVTARKLTPYTKLYNEEKNKEMYVFLDLSPSMVFGTKREFKSVSAAKIASLLGWLSFENKDKFGCFIFDGENHFFFKPQSSRASLLAILKKISEVTKNVAENKFNLTNDFDFEKNIKLLQKSIKNRATVFIVSDFYSFDDKVKKSIGSLSKKSNLYLINVFDKIEQDAPEEGEYMIGYMDENLIFNTRDDNFRKQYLNYFVHKNEIIKDFCLKFSCRFISVSTGMPIFRQIRFS